jgi:alanine racemase/UDP-N-acetylmuramoyl-tripeptide--D-alanyl-D-alanine ligase
MDYMMVDVSDIPEAKIGDQALLFGEDDNGHYIAPEELAHLGSSIIHELMTCLGPRIRYFFIYDESLRPR